MSLSSVALFKAVCSDIDHLSIEGNPLDRVGLSYRSFAASSLRYSVIRKWIPKDSREADASALANFISANNRCKEWSLPPMDDFDSLIFNEMKKELDNFFHCGEELLVQSYFDLFRRSKPGPGVAVGALGTSFYTKYMASKLTTTSEYLYEEYRRYSEWIPALGEAEELRRQKLGSASIVNGSRCCFVPKTSATSRMICIEPSLNMFCQLGLGAILEDRLKSYFGIDLALQPQVNRLLAKEGSLTDRLCTVDLSSASDSISIRLCEHIFPKWFFELLLVLRSRVTSINGSEVPLFMISTMGNGFTFPLQTIIFSALLRAVSSFHSQQLGRGFTWSCFGDDLICDSYCYRTVVRLLSKLGFTVNPAKSFSEGPFRESCGADWFLGQPVRPVFIRKLDLPFDILVAINQLNEWTSYTGIPLKNTLQLLLHSLPHKFRLMVPYDSSNDCGIRVPSFFIKPKYDSNLSFVYKTWDRRPSKVRVSEGKIHLPSGRECLYNPPGLYCSFLFGELVDYTIMVRHDLRLYRTRRRVTPNWDYMPTGRITNGVVLSHEQWKTALLTNMTFS